MPIPYTGCSDLRGKDACIAKDVGEAPLARKGFRRRSASRVPHVLSHLELLLWSVHAEGVPVPPLAAAAEGFQLPLCISDARDIKLWGHLLVQVGKHQRHE